MTFSNYNFMSLILKFLDFFKYIKFKFRIKIKVKRYFKVIIFYIICRRKLLKFLVLYKIINIIKNRI